MVIMQQSHLIQGFAEINNPVPSNLVVPVGMHLNCSDHTVQSNKEEEQQTI